MFHNRKFNSYINTIHERDLTILYSERNSAFDELLENDGSFKIQDRYLL